MSLRSFPSILRRTFVVFGAAGAAACGGDGPIVTRPQTPPAAPVVVTMLPQSLTLNAGATGLFAVSITGGSPTPTLQGCSSNAPAVASAAVNGAGCQVTGIAPGNAVVTATTTGGQQASSGITVLALPPALTNLSVTPASASLSVGQTAGLVASVSVPAGATVAYTAVSSNATVATVSSGAATPTVTAVSVGSATITVTATATGPGLAATTRSVAVPITVTAPAVVTISPTSLTLQTGSTGALAVGIVGGTPTPTLVSCSSAVTAVATVSVSGTACQVTAVAPGATAITATVSSGQTVQAAITVVAPSPAISAFSVAPSTVSVGVGQNTTLTPAITRGGTAVAVEYTFGSSAPSVATVSASGAVTGVAPGTATVTVTARGSGTGFATTVLTATVPVTVTAANACDASALSLDVAVSRSIVSTDCAFQTSGGRVDNYRLTVPSTRVVRLEITASFSSVGVLGRTVGAQASVWFSSAGSSASANFLMPAGSVDVGALATAAQTGTYQFSATSQLEDVSSCRNLTVLGNAETAQQLTAQSCLVGGWLFDRFYVYAPGRSCSISMRRVSTAGSIGDPLLEAWRSDGSTLFLENDDESNLTLDARITLPSCVDPAGNAVDIRAGDLNAGTGLYRLTVTFGNP
jgi:uncharacterized protein YjdB